MIRFFSVETGLFLAPFLLYAAYLWATRAGVIDRASWPLPRLVWLVMTALLLMIGSFLVLAQFSGAPPGSVYVPAHVENGRVVPGETVGAPRPAIAADTK